LSFCEELHRPLRRAEKKVLNDWMIRVRFPMKDRVQQPSHKSYVLLLAAIARIHIKEFTLRIEQAEIVDNALRLLRCLQELSLHNCEGCLLESCILLERALRTRLWESGGNIFIQCAGLTDSTRDAMQLSGLTTLDRVIECSLQQLTRDLRCNINEARTILFFSQELIGSRLIATMDTIDGSQLSITVRTLQTNNGGSILQPTSNVGYQLVVVDSDTCRLLCYRNIQPQMKQSFENGGGNGTLRFVIPLPAQTLMDRVKLALYASVVGIDFVQEPVLVKSADIVKPQKRVVIRNKARMKLTPTAIGSDTPRNPFETYKLQPTAVVSSSTSPSSTSISNLKIPTKGNHCWILPGDEYSQKELNVRTDVFCLWILFTFMFLDN
jgi:hypothetical protein